ncbi:MAG: hypothetical protein KF716_19115 [Anaerolineae bacterium]|nr:hypothetical protein [Anaerolineae bacterium]
MGTWISHLRIAEQLLAAIPDLDEIGFTLGSLAPDSGVPVPGPEYRFEPPKTITHFLNKGDDEGRIRDLDFYRGYVAALDPDADLALYSFGLAYFFHLIADNLWALHMVRTHQEAYAWLFDQKGGAAWWDFKRDWYDLDHKYVRDHPHGLFQRVLLTAPNPPCYFPFLVESALHSQLNDIRTFYAQPDPDRVLDRAYPYLNAATMDRYVGETVAAIMSIYQHISEHGAPADHGSSIMLLTAADRAPYPPPIGDPLP